MSNTIQLGNPDLLKPSDSVAIEEFRFVYSMFIERARTANNFWLTGFVSAYGALFYVYKNSDLTAAIFASTLISVFNVALAWQLEEITKLRTYSYIVLESRLNINWERCWYFVGDLRLLAKASRIRVLIVFMSPSLILFAGLFYFMFTLKRPDDVLAAKSTDIFVCISAFLYIYSIICMYSSFSAERYRWYFRVWRDLPWKVNEQNQPKI